MKILVTGGAGFIGSALVRALLKRGDQTVVFDNFATGRRENLAEVAADPALRIQEGDLRNPDDCRRAVAGVDAILHEAALGSVPRSLANPAETIAVNVAGFANLLEAAVRAGVPRVVYASSSSVYGDDPSPAKREDRTGQPLSPYAAGKGANELIATAFARGCGLACVGLRYFNVFGPRQAPDGAYAAVIPKFILALRNGETPTIYGDGTNSRDFTYVDNVVAANLAALHAPAPDNPVCNIAGGAATSLNDLYAMLCAELGITDRPARHAPPRPGDIAHSLAELDRARELLGYTPQIGVAEGLRRTCRWYRENGQ